MLPEKRKRGGKKEKKGLGGLLCLKLEHFDKRKKRGEEKKKVGPHEALPVYALKSREENEEKRWEGKKRWAINFLAPPKKDKKREKTAVPPPLPEQKKKRG